MPPLHRPKCTKTRVKAVQQSIALGRFGTPEEVANLVAFVASPAASLLVGSNIHINGGQLKQVHY